MINARAVNEAVASGKAVIHKIISPHKITLQARFCLRLKIDTRD